MSNRYLLLFFLIFDVFNASMGQTLSGVIDVNNNSGSVILLVDDYYYQLCPGDKVSISIQGTANIAPRDEERSGGGFLGCFKKHYKARIDDWLKASEVTFDVRIASGNLTFTSNNATGSKSSEIEIQFDVSDQPKQLLSAYKVNAWVNQYTSPLRAGKYDISVKIDSEMRARILRKYLIDKLMSPTTTFLDFEGFLVPLLENGRIIRKQTDILVSTLDSILDTSSSIRNAADIRKSFYTYLLKYSPDNTSIRSKLAKNYLNDLSFIYARANSVTSIQKILSQETSTDPEHSNLKTEQMIDLGRSYEVLGGVEEAERLGLNEDAYVLAANYYAEAAKWYDRSHTTAEYANALIKQSHSLQKIGDIPSLEAAAKVLQEFVNRR